MLLGELVVYVVPSRSRSRVAIESDDVVSNDATETFYCHILSIKTRLLLLEMGTLLQIQFVQKMNS